MKFLAILLQGHQIYLYKIILTSVSGLLESEDLKENDKNDKTRVPRKILKVFSKSYFADNLNLRRTQLIPTVGTAVELSRGYNRES